MKSKSILIDEAHEAATMVARVVSVSGCWGKETFITAGLSRKGVVVGGGRQITGVPSERPPPP